MPITLVNFREGVAGDWIVEQWTHGIDKEVGFKTSVNGMKSLKEEE